MRLRPAAAHPPPFVLPRMRTKPRTTRGGIIPVLPLSPPAVSICIRASARPPDLLRGAIESVLEQTFADLEVVVSDDSGRMGQVAEAFGDARIRYHANPRPAGSVANLRR